MSQKEIHFEPGVSKGRPFLDVDVDGDRYQA
jgi:hypothetical protein